MGRINLCFGDVRGGPVPQEIAPWLKKSINRKSGEREQEKMGGTSKPLGADGRRAARHFDNPK